VKRFDLTVRVTPVSVTLSPVVYAMVMFLVIVVVILLILLIREKRAKVSGFTNLSQTEYRKRRPVGNRSQSGQPPTAHHST